MEEAINILGAEEEIENQGGTGKSQWMMPRVKKAVQGVSSVKGTTATIVIVHIIITAAVKAKAKATAEAEAEATIIIEIIC